MNRKSYILVTAAYNEALYIEKTISSIINQDILPLRWIIVNDGSTDGTAEIVKKYAVKYPFIDLINRKKKGIRDFASKVGAIQIAVDNLNFDEFEYIGILDADISFEHNYYYDLMVMFEKDLKLGIAGGIFYDVHKDNLISVYASPYSVRGAVQFFRKECYAQIGGLLPIKYGGEDAAACYAARMHGWKIQNFTSLVVMHHKPTGTADSNILMARFKDGFVEYHLGYHPLFQFLKCLRRILAKPIFIGSVLRLLGFWLAMIKREKRELPGELIKFIRIDQFHRILKLDY